MDFEPREESLFETILLKDERIIWSGEPCEIPFKIENIKRVFVQTVLTCAYIFIFLMVYHIIFDWDFFPTQEIPNFLMITTVIFLSNGFFAIKRIFNVRETRYYLTNKRIIVCNNLKKAKIQVIDKQTVVSTKLIKSQIDRMYNVETVLVELKDDTFFIQSVSDGKTAIEMIRSNVA